jgi:hypothetical protein
LNADCLECVHGGRAAPEQPGRLGEAERRGLARQYAGGHRELVRLGSGESVPEDLLADGERLTFEPGRIRADRGDDTRDLVPEPERQRPIVAAYRSLGAFEIERTDRRRADGDHNLVGPGRLGDWMSRTLMASTPPQAVAMTACTMAG